MRVALSLNFKNQSVNGDYYIQLFEKLVRFEPDRMSYKKAGKSWNVKSWNRQRHTKLISECSQDDDIIVSLNENIFITSQTGTANPHRSITIIHEQQNFSISNNEVESLIRNDVSFLRTYMMMIMNMLNQQSTRVIYKEED